MIIRRTFPLLLAATALCVSPSALWAQQKSATDSGGARPRKFALEEAQSAFRQRDFDGAVEPFREVVAANPHDGQSWYNFGFCLHSLKRHDEAIKPFEKAAELGFQPAAAIYNIACAHAMMGHTDEALKWLEKSLVAGFNQDELMLTDADLDSLREDARFKKLMGAVAPDGLTREERWSHDLDHLVRRMEKVHYNLYAKVAKESFYAAVNALKARTSELKDEEMAVGIQSILALVGDGHTTLAGEPGDDPSVSRYLVELYLYKEGLYVRGAAPSLADIVGGEVVRIGKASAEEALRAVAPLCSHDNTMGVKLQSPQFLTRPAVLSYLKLTDDMNGVTLEVRKADGELKKAELKPEMITMSQASGFVRANASAKTPEPPAFKKNDEEFWFEYVPDKKLVYFQFNAVANKVDQTLAEFCTKLFAFINDKPVEYLVIDMRNNGGGNNFLNRPLVHGLIRSDKIDRAGHLFVLIGRRTFSAAMNGAVDIERNTHAIFVGEPTGSSPNFVGETSILVLPCSKLRLSCSSLYWQSSTATDRRTWIAPTLVAEPSIAAFTQNRDPGMEAIFAYIDAR
jgi:tetratricopeptide (TPR) repeat protein